MRVYRNPNLAKAAAVRNPVLGRSPASPVPQTVGGLALWLDSSVVQLPDGTAVSVAPDRSGNARDAVVQGGAGIPTYAGGAFGGKGGGIACVSQTTFELSGPALVIPDAGDVAVFAVYAPVSGSNAAVIAVAPAAAGYGIGLLFGTVMLGCTDAGAYVERDITAPTVPTQLRWVRRSGAWTYGASGIGDSAPLAGGTGQITISYLIHSPPEPGYAVGGSAVIGEVLIYSGTVSPEDEARIVAYLASKWGVAQ